MRYFLTLAGEVAPVEVSELTSGEYRVLHEGRSYTVSVHGDNVLVDGRVVPCTLDPERGRAELGTQSLAYAVSREDPRLSGALASAARPEVRSPMPGKIVEVRCEQGESVSAGQCLIVVEAMKMQNELVAPAAGTVQRVLVSAGKAVEAGALLLELDVVAPE